VTFFVAHQSIVWMWYVFPTMTFKLKFTSVTFVAQPRTGSQMAMCQTYQIVDIGVCSFVQHQRVLSKFPRVSTTTLDLLNCVGRNELRCVSEAFKNAFAASKSASTVCIRALLTGFMDLCMMASLRSRKVECCGLFPWL
jgi:hypothetical protein